MPNLKTDLSRRATLRDLHWFTIRDDLDTQTHYTTWQAIAYLIHKLFSDDRILIFKYSRMIDIAELQFLGLWGEQVIDPSSDQTGNYHSLRDLCRCPSGATPKLGEKGWSRPNFNLFKGIEYRVSVLSNLLLTDNGPFDKVIDRLERWRYSAVGHLSLPDVLHTILSNQIEKYRAGKNSALTIIEHRPPQLTHPIPLISKSSLDKWRALKSLKSLGWGDPDQERPSSKIREDALANNERVMAVMIHILAELFPKPFAKSGDPGKPNFSAIEKFIGQNVVTEESNFPQSRTRTSVLTESYSRIASDLRVHSPLRISRHHDVLSTHYDKLPRRKKREQ